MHVEVTCAANVQPVVCTQGVFGLVCVCVRGGRSDQGILGGPSGRRIGNLTLHSKIPCTTRSMPASSGVKEYHGCRMALIQDLAVVRCGCAVQDVEMGKLRAREQWAHRRAELLHAHVSELQASSPTEISDAAAVAPLRKQISCLHTLLLHCAPSFTLGYVHDSELYTRLDSAESTTVALRSQVGDLMSANDRLASSLLALRNGNGNSNGNGNVMPHEHMYPPLDTLSPCHMYPPLDTLSPCHMYPPLDTLSPCHMYPPLDTLSPCHMYPPLDTLSPCHMYPPLDTLSPCHMYPPLDTLSPCHMYPPLDTLSPCHMYPPLDTLSPCHMYPPLDTLSPCHMYPPLDTLSPCHMYPPLDTLSPCHMYPPLDTLSPCHMYPPLDTLSPCHMYPPLDTLSPCHMYPPLDTLSPCHMYPPLDTLSPCHSTLPWTHFLLATVPSLGHTFSLPYLSFNEVGSVPRRVLPACSPLQLPYNIANVDEVVRNNGKQARTRVCAARAW